MKEGISSHQLLTLSFVALLSPFLRLLPSTVAEQAGSAAWVSAALSLLPAGLLAAIISSLRKSFPQGKGLSHLLTDFFGKFGGSLVIFLWSLWLVFHSGFLLRSGADRFIATIYPTAKPLFFIAVMGALCTVAAFGHIKPLARSAELFRPLLLFVIGLVLVFTLEDVEPTFLLPVTDAHIEGIAKGLPLAAEAVSVALVCMAFLLGCVRPEAKPRSLLPWLLGATALNVLLCTVSVGSLGKTYTAALSYPFFIMARDLSILSGVERIEALVVGLWLLPDFVLITLELIIVSDNLLYITGRSESQKGRSLCILAAAIPAVIVALRIAPNSQAIQRWSDMIVPAIHLGWAYLILPLLWIIGRLRKKF